MGLFSTTLSIYKKDQPDIIDALKKELKEKRKLATFDRILVSVDNFQEILDSQVYLNQGIFYLVAYRFSNWTTILELNVNLNDPFYLYEIANAMSLRLKTYSLSLHLHDDDVIFYNLEHNGNSLDGYNSNVQYFENEPLKQIEIINQRHDAAKFLELLPSGKNIEGLNEILNRGYWNAFDNNDLDMDGIPNDEIYEVEEEQRLKEIGRYLEIYNNVDFPYANWHDDIYELNLSKCYLLRANK